MTDAGRSIPFFFVDVFAVEPLSGNPLAVVDGAAALPLDLLQRIAREFNQSETTFVLPPTRAGADWRLRSFTPAGVEVFGAGHNALGAWWWLAHAGKLSLRSDATSFHQEIGDRVLPVTIVRRDGQLAHIVMEQEPPVTGRIVEDADLDALAASLGLTRDELAVARVPCQVVSTGAPHLLVPIRDRDTVDRIRPDARALFDALARAGGEGCYVYSQDPRVPEASAYARFFNPTVGIAEDPATGTAAGPLVTHLLAHGIVPPGVTTIEQGTAIGRTSLIQIEVDANQVRISGRGIVVASGHLHL